MLRKRFMEWWWGWLGPGHTGVQNAVGRAVCAVAGHEQGRSIHCDWCGTIGPGRRRRR